MRPGPDSTRAARHRLWAQCGMIATNHTARQESGFALWWRSRCVRSCWRSGCETGACTQPRGRRDTTGHGWDTMPRGEDSEAGRVTEGKGPQNRIAALIGIAGPCASQRTPSHPPPPCIHAWVRRGRRVVGVSVTARRTGLDERAWTKPGPQWRAPLVCAPPSPLGLCMRAIMLTMADCIASLTVPFC